MLLMKYLVLLLVLSANNPALAQTCRASGETGGDSEWKVTEMSDAEWQYSMRLRRQESFKTLGSFVDEAHQKLESLKGDPYLREMAAKYQSLYPIGRSQTPSTRPTRPAAEASSDTLSCSGSISNPVFDEQVIPATGEALLDEKDFLALNNYGFSLTRTYRSRTGVSFIFGNRWSSNLDPMYISKYGGCSQIGDMGCWPNYARLYEPGCAQYSYSLDTQSELYTVNNSAAMGFMVWNIIQGSFALYRDNLVYRFNSSGYLTTVDTHTTPALRVRTYTYSSERSR